MRRRIYVDKSFAQRIKKLAVEEEKSVISLTKDLDVVFKDIRKTSHKKRGFGFSKGWVDL